MSNAQEPIFKTIGATTEDYNQVLFTDYLRMEASDH